MTSELARRRGQRTASRSEDIAIHLRERIAGGEFAVGETLPSERTLVGEWGVAKMTVSRAIGKLKSEGLIGTAPGIGLVVLERRAGVSPHAQLERMHRHERIRRDNEHTVIAETGVMDSARVAPAIVAAIGHTPQSGETIYRRRVIYRDGEVMCLATSWVPATALSTQRGWPAVRERLLSYDLVEDGTPLLLADLVDQELAREDYTASAETAGVREAEELNVRTGAPVLRVISTVHATSWPLECGVYTYPAGLPCSFPSKVLL